MPTNRSLVFETWKNSSYGNLPLYTLEFPTLISAIHPSVIPDCFTPEDADDYVEVPVVDGPPLSSLEAAKQIANIIPSNSRDWCEISLLGEYKLRYKEELAHLAPNEVSNCQFATGFQYNKFFITYYHGSYSSLSF